ncbi:Tat binding protein 1-interacting protein-domain-containing protein [Dichotomocladium elegans]|nr:Tat binding protein 1-interacting protein-domain-containing protein [Dichotomocladium elegans]
MGKKKTPYSLEADIFNNLHGKQPKTDIVKALERLTEQDVVVSKLYGKMSIYSIKQASEAIQTEIDQLTKTLEEISQENLKLTQTLRTTTNTPTTQDARAMADKLQQENTIHKQRLQKLKAGQELIDQEEKTKINKQFDAMRKEWRSRRKLVLSREKFRDIFDTITEHLPNKPSEFKDELGIEDDPIPYEKDPLSSSV